MSSVIPSYFPPFLWKFWVSKSGQTSHSLDDERVHIYDTWSNELSETRRIPKESRTVFQDIGVTALDHRGWSALQEAEAAFVLLESEAEAVLQYLLPIVTSPDNDNNKSSKKRRVVLDRRAANTLRRFFVFLRYRNSDKYRATVESLSDTSKDDDDDDDDVGHVPRLLHRVRRRLYLEGVSTFLRLYPGNVPFVGDLELKECCWNFCNAEISFGLATAGQEYILTDRCFGTLDEELGGNDTHCCDLFFPITPTTALYILGNSEEDDQDVRPSLEPLSIDWGIESQIDIHLRNAVLLQSYPRRIYFSSLLSTAQSIASYDEFRLSSDHLDYSRLKSRCRQKYTQETVTKTLVIKGSFILTDLTDDVVPVGGAAVAHGSFSDVWKGIWTDRVEQKSRSVAMKFLRQVMVEHVKEKFLKRLQDEVLAWYRLQHPNIAQLFGVVQTSNSIAMVSSWCAHGTICHYLKEVKPYANRLDLLLQVASGVSYLHDFEPVVVHGDLKGGNILINEEGQAIITDFGLSKVMEELSDQRATSFFAGSTRWMAPELVLALVEDNGRPPPLTTSSDVYAFASVCLEVVSGQVPYPHRSNDHAVTVDIMRGVKPSRATSCYINGKDHELLWTMLDRCWDAAFYLRPDMSELTTFLRSMTGTIS